MKQFIKLHNSNDNTIIIVNSSKIDLIDTEWSDDRNRSISHIYLNSNSVSDFYVNETAEKIFQMFNEK